jgi:hypothetical protein
MLFFSFSILLYYRNYTLMRNNSVRDGFPKFIDMFLQTICVREKVSNNMEQCTIPNKIHLLIKF